MQLNMQQAHSSLAVTRSLDSLRAVLASPHETQRPATSNRRTTHRAARAALCMTGMYAPRTPCESLASCSAHADTYRQHHSQRPRNHHVERTPVGAPHANVGFIDLAAGRAILARSVCEGCSRHRRGTAEYMHASLRPTHDTVRACTRRRARGRWPSRTRSVTSSLAGSPRACSSRAWPAGAACATRGGT